MTACGEVLSLLALLVQKYKYWPKVQILGLERRTDPMKRLGPIEFRQKSIYNTVSTQEAHFWGSKVKRGDFKRKRTNPITKEGANNWDCLDENRVVIFISGNVISTGDVIST
jgi:hypothetical protein